MESEKYFEELDKLEDDGISMWCAAPKLHDKHPQITVGECNKIVLDWIRERGYYARYIKNA